MQVKSQDIEKSLIEITQQFISESGEGFAAKKVTIDLSLQQHLGIDSVSKAELFSRIEKQFDVQLSQQLLAEANTLQDILNVLISSSPQKIVFSQGKITPLTSESHVDVSSAKTLMDVLLLFAMQAPDRPHIYLQDEYGKEEIITYGKLFETALCVANVLRQQYDLRADETVAIMLPTSAGFFYTFFGVLLANCVPVPVYPPFRPHQIEAYAKQEAKILRNAEVRMLVTFHQAENLSQMLRAFIPSLKYVVNVDSLLQSKERSLIHSRTGEDFALIQYTSGSTSTPKGVLLTHNNLLANICAYGKGIGVTSKDVSVSWVPLYHDLGLIGMWFGSLYFGLPLAIMSPLTFLTRPERWLWTIHSHRGTISGGPNFAYELCVRKIDPAQIEGLDLSSWRLAFNGAEAIHPETLRRFTEKFSPYGFRSETHYPVYGLAESSVCLAVSPLNRGPRFDVIEREALEKNGRAIIAESNSSKSTLELVACGIPLPEHEVRIVDDKGKVLPERHVGHIQFRGPSSMQGYYNNPEATRAVFHDGWWDTGDLAYIADREIFITGRKKDVIIKAGRNLYPAEIEELTGQIPGIRKGCVIAFGISDPHRGTEKLVVVAETNTKDSKEREDIIAKVNENISEALDIIPDHTVLVSPHVIPKTSSGKLQRSACKTLYETGKLTPKGIPPWLQITKLILNVVKSKLLTALSKAGKFICTLYATLLLIITVFPLWLSVWIIPKSTAKQLCRWWAKLFTLLIFCPILTNQKNNLYKNKPVIFAPNHASYIDAIVMLAVLPAGTCFVGKSELLKTPFIRTFMRKLDYIAVDRVDASKGVEDTKEITDQLLQGHSVLIFPEGTFSYALGLRPFKVGAFKIAAETKTPICPIAMQGTRAILRGEEWLMKPHYIKVTVLDPIMPQGDDWQEISRLKNSVREEIAKHCGEPTLDLIMAGVAAPKNKLNKEST